jgi:uncharacterized protein YkwD
MRKPGARRARVMLLLVIAGCGASTMSAPTSATSVSPSERHATALVNRYRALAGVPPVGIDAALGRGCAEHASYLWQNRGTAALEGLRVHGQDPTLPGASPRGAACGKAGVIDQAARDGADAVEAWMGTLYHRAPLLAPYVRRIGVGAAGPAYARAVVMTFGLQPAPAARWPIAFPADGQTGVRTDFVREVPNPIPNGRTGGGYPFTLQFPPHDTLTAVTATFVDAAGAPVPFYLSTPERPANPHHAQRGIVGVIPREPLHAATRYTVTVRATWRGRRGQWSSTFATMDRIRVEATDRAALFAAADQPARLRGVVERGGMVSPGNAYLVLAPADDSYVVEVRLPHAAPHSLRGATVEIDGTPAQLGASAIRVVATGFRVVAGN